MENNQLKVKKSRKILKKILLGVLVIMLAGAAVFVTAGMIPREENDTFGTRKSTYVTMKDGTKIAVRYTLPKGLEKGEKLPAIMECTRYGTKNKVSFLLNALLNLKIGRELPPVHIETLAKSNYAYVAVDARGSGASFGKREMELSKAEIEDMGQVIDWISKQPWSNGKVGSYGMSYSGNTAELAAVPNHPALLAAAPLYPDFDLVSQLARPGGIFNEVLIKEWSESTTAMDSNKINDPFFGGIAPVDEDKDEKLLKKAIKEHHTIDIYQSFKNITYLDDILAGKYTANSLAPYNYKNEIEKSNVPLYIRVGWQDAGTVNGAIERFLTYQNNQTLVIGPWSHGGWNYCDPYIMKPSAKRDLEKAQADELVKFFDMYLKNENKISGTSTKEILYYTLGEGKWKTTKTWPVEGFQNKTFYFNSNQSLKETKPSDANGRDIYKVDFSTSTGKTNRWFTNMGGGNILYLDRSEEDKKLLTYTSETLENDVEITGVPVVTLNLSSTASDGAFFVYLEDVAPDGKVTYITEGELRALHRKTTQDDIGHTVIGPKHSYLKKDGEMLTPGKNTEIKIGMYATSVLIKKGHKIRIAVAGHDAANFERIPENENPTLEVQRNNILSSYVELPMKIRQ